MLLARGYFTCLVAFAASVTANPVVTVKRVTQAGSSVSPSSLTVTITSKTAGTVPYYVPLDGISYSFAVSHSSLGSTDEFGLVTVVDAGKSATLASIKSTIASYASEDDVFDESFLSSMFSNLSTGVLAKCCAFVAVFLKSSSSPKLSSSLVSGLASTFDVSNIFASTSIPSAKGVASAVLSSKEAIPIGPYVYRIDASSKTASFWPVYRLYPDPQEASSKSFNLLYHSLTLM
jgi:hypothetical protein